MVTDRCRPFSPPVRAFNFIAHRVQHSHCSSIFIECLLLLTHALALSAIIITFLCKRKSLRVCALDSVRVELAKKLVITVKAAVLIVEDYWHYNRRSEDVSQLATGLQKGQKWSVSRRFRSKSRYCKSFSFSERADCRYVCIYYVLRTTYYYIILINMYMWGDY